MAAIKFKIQLDDGRTASCSVDRQEDLDWVKKNPSDVFKNIKETYPSGEIPPELHLSIPRGEEIVHQEDKSAPVDVQEAVPSQEVSKTRLEWTPFQTRKLISLVDDNLDALKSTRNKQSIWKIIAAEFSDDLVTSTKCEDKWKNLKRAYRDYVQKCSRSRSGTTKFEFSDEMATVLGDDPSVTPKVTLDSGGNMAVASQSSSTDATEDPNNQEEQTSQETSEPSATVPSRPKKSKRTTMSDVLQYMKVRDEKMMEQLKEIHSENVAVLKKIADKL